MTKDMEIRWRRAGLRNVFYSFRDYLSLPQRDDFERIMKIAKPKDLIPLTQEWKRLAYYFIEDERERKREYIKSHHVCNECKRDLLLIDFRYKKRVKCLSGEYTLTGMKFHLSYGDICKWCYKESLIDADVYVKSLLKKQGIENISEEIIKTKKLTLLIKRELRNAAK